MIRTLLSVCALPTLLFGAPFTLTVDQLRSEAHVDLCLTIIGTACDSATSPVGGSITLALDCPPSPATVTLHDYRLTIADDVTLNIVFPDLGDFNGLGRTVEVAYPSPGSPLPPVPLVNESFSVVDVPASVTGELDYEATDVLCLAFRLAEYNCTDTIDLSTITVQPITLDGTLSVEGSDVTLTADVSISGPIDSDNPDLGTLAVDAAIVATGQVPPPCCPGDLTGDDRVDLADHDRLVDCLLGPAGGAVGACQCADLDENGDVDLGEVAEFQRIYSSP